MSTLSREYRMAAHPVLIDFIDDLCAVQKEFEDASGDSEYERMIYAMSCVCQKYLENVDDFHIETVYDVSSFYNPGEEPALLRDRRFRPSAAYTNDDGRMVMFGVSRRDVHWGDFGELTGFIDTLVDRLESGSRVMPQALFGRALLKNRVNECVRDLETYYASA